MGGLVIWRVDLEHVPSGKANEILEMEAAHVKSRLAKVFNEDVSVLALEKNDDFEYFSDDKLKLLGLTRIKDNSAPPEATGMKDQHGNFIPEDVVNAIKMRIECLAKGDLNRCTELRDTIRMHGYEILDTTSGPVCTKRG